MKKDSRRTAPKPGEDVYWAIFRREVILLWQRQRFLLLLSIVTPLLYALFFCGLYSKHRIADIPITIVDQDHSRLSRQITTAILSSEVFRLGQYAASPDVFPTLAAAEQSQACFTFPRNFERDVFAGRSAKVAVWVNTSNIATANVSINGASEVIGAFAAGVTIRRLRMLGFGGRNAALVQPAHDEYRVMYNPALNANYANFMLLGFVCVSIQLLTVLLGAESISREVEDGTAGELYAISPRTWPVILGKASVYLCIMLPTSLCSLIVSLVGGQVPCKGDPLLVGLITLWFIVILLLTAIGVSALSREGLFSIQILAIIVMPSFLLSGFTWPTMAMPLPIQALSNAEPISHYLMVIRRISLMGGGVGSISAEVRALGIWTVFSLILAYVAVHKFLKDVGGGRVQSPAQ